MASTVDNNIQVFDLQRDTWKCCGVIVNEVVYLLYISCLTIDVYTYILSYHPYAVLLMYLFM